ncbi:nascent polypeptide-associated complex subunit alpha, muscle-specific form-like [Rhipicephalus sanguineus]|uniref:nascent polypeptide-associated complex subunit alpha, muscle-specific form-like n=1 Tax=Rhipicephalus sanguineus TaxID=34632 RepID=UPI0020C1BB92|nr:nascent polypeptide-associated complex subunit alpha, muscle-specific form-like [Rhipicephalus sanguineus]
MPSGVPGQPTVVVPSVSVGVSVPESQSSSPPSLPYSEFTTPFPLGPSGVPTEPPVPSGVPSLATAVVPSVSVGVSVPEAQTGSQPSYPHGEFTKQLPSAPSVVPTTETMPSGVPGQPTVFVPSVSVGVSVPESQTSSPPSFPYSEFTTPFPPGPSGVPATEPPVKSGVPGQPTAVVPSVSVGVSVPEAQTGSQPSYPHGEFTTQFPSVPSVVPTTETMPSGVPGQPTVVPSVSDPPVYQRQKHQYHLVFLASLLPSFLPFL